MFIKRIYSISHNQLLSLKLDNPAAERIWGLSCSCDLQIMGLSLRDHWPYSYTFVKTSWKAINLLSLSLIRVIVQRPGCVTRLIYVDICFLMFRNELQVLQIMLPQYNKKCKKQTKSKRQEIVAKQPAIFSRESNKRSKRYSSSLFPYSC